MCRKSFRLPIANEWAQNSPVDENGIHIANCPSCGARMIDVGMDFKVPKLQDTRAWRAAEILLNAGIRYQGCGCDAGGWKPRTPEGALARVDNQSRSQIQRVRQQRSDERQEYKQGRRDLRLQRIKQRNLRPTKP